MDASPNASSSGTEGSAQALALHVTELRRLFNSLDPAPFRQRDLDPAASDYIVEWAQEQPAAAPLGLVVHTDLPAPAADAASLRGAVQEYFRDRQRSTERRLRKLLRTGRISLLIGLAFLAAAVVIGESIASLFSKERYVTLVQESLIIGGWVALWRPMEIFLYDWWPIRAEARLYARLAAMDVRLRQANPEAMA